MPTFLFVNGQGGVGKSAVVRYFQEHPLRGWMFFDFDHGKYPLPQDGATKEEWDTWKNKQLSWWLTVMRASSEAYAVSVVLCGVLPFPWKLEQLQEWKEVQLDVKVAHAYLTCSPEIRKQRLSGRGDVHLFDQFSTNMTHIEEKMNAYGAQRIDTSAALEDVAKMIEKYIQSLR